MIRQSYRPDPLKMPLLVGVPLASWGGILWLIWRGVN